MLGVGWGAVVVAFLQAAFKVAKPALEQTSGGIGTGDCFGDLNLALESSTSNAIMVKPCQFKWVCSGSVRRTSKGNKPITTV